MNITPPASLAHIPLTGHSVPRVEDDALLTGSGRFADDLAVRPGTLHAAVLRSPHAHALIRSIDTTRALALDGVTTVVTGDDARRWTLPFVVGVKQPMEHWSVAVDRVRYVGEPVAIVAARSRELAEDAAELIRVEYEPLPAVTDIEQAITAEAPVLHAGVGSNIVSDRSYRYGDPDAAFAQAAHRVALSVRYPRNSCTPMECGVVLAEHLPGDGSYDVTSNFMGPFSLHTVMALALRLPSSRLRHRYPPDSGGSFGVKQSVFPMVVALCVTARKAGAPVKWVEDRLEHLTAATSATGRLCHIEAAVDADGCIRALRYDQFDDVGGYLRAPEPATFYRMHGCLSGAYAIEHLAVRNRVVLTNKTPAGLVRGFGGPQVYFALERLVARIAVELKLDVLAVYRRNFVPAKAFPYRAAAGALLDSGDYDGALRAAVDEGGYAELDARRAAARAEGRLYGIGFAAIVEPSISNMGYISTVLTAEQRARAGPKNGAVATATVGIDPLGGVLVTLASAPAGQGHRTVCAQVVADVFGLTLGEITVNTDFDTQKDAWSVAEGNYSSRFAGAVAGVVHLAAMRLRERIARIAAATLGSQPSALVFSGGKVHDATRPGTSIAFGRVASTMHWAPALVPREAGLAPRETVFWTPECLTAPDAEDRVNTSAAYGFAFDLCAVEVERATGRVRIDRYVTCHDAGRLLHPAMADGQIRGGFAQGVGAALMEEFRYGADGSFQSGSFADYLVPTACEIPDPVIVHRETPSPFTPLGAKGIGEGNNMSTPVCIANAVADALSTVRDIADIRLPLTPGKVLELIGFDDPPPSTRATGATPASVAAPSFQPGAAPARHAAAASPGDAAIGVSTPPAPQREAPAASGLSGKAAGRARPGAMTARGSVHIDATPDALFALLMDPVALGRIIPGCHRLEVVDAHTFRADVSIGVGVVRARYATRIALSEIDAPRSLRLTGSGASALGDASGSGRITLEPVNESTRLHYDYTIEVGGRIAAVGSRLLEGAARVVLAQVFERLAREATGTPVVAESWLTRLLRRLGLK